MQPPTEKRVVYTVSLRWTLADSSQPLMITSFCVNLAWRRYLLIAMAVPGRHSGTIQQHNQSDIWLADESQAERVCGSSWRGL